jgi:outer membrane lipoprotein-sorting protein
MLPPPPCPVRVRVAVQAVSPVSCAVGLLSIGFAEAKALGDYMVVRFFRLSMILSSVVVSAWLPSDAAPTGGTINFTPPLTSAKTIQVTETVWEAQNGSTPGPLQKGGIITFRIERPDRFRVEMKPSSPGQPTSYYISDGKTMVGYDGKQVRSQAAARAEWPFPMMGLLNNAPGPVSAVRAIRGGKQVLLAVRPSPSARQEFWFDPETHLLIRDMMFLTWQGKTSEVMRTEYTGWALNKPLSPAVFRAPATNTGHK